jgi:hypothetical protein
VCRQEFCSKFYGKESGVQLAGRLLSWSWGTNYCNVKIKDDFELCASNDVMHEKVRMIFLEKDHNIKKVKEEAEKALKKLEKLKYRVEVSAF